MPKRVRFEDWDPVAFLQGEGIPHKFSGDNVGQEWVGVEECPMCGAPNHHFGIMLHGIHWCSCFVCGETCSPLDFIKKVLHLPTGRAITKMLEYSTAIPSDIEAYKEERKPPPSKINWPVGTDYELNPAAISYLKHRKFDPQEIETKYGIKSTGPVGNFAYRILMPVFHNLEMVTFTGRDYTGKQKERYKSLSNTDSVIPIKSCVYNLDRISERVVIVEGITDVWRLGDLSVAMLGTKYTMEQILLLRNKGIKIARVLFDPKAEPQAENLAEVLANFIPNVKVCSLDVDKDPGGLTDREARLVMRSIFL